MKNTFIYDKVNELVIAELEKGNVPWQKPWRTNIPKNISTKKAYQGSNIFTLFFAQDIFDYKSSYWGTYKQISALGGAVKKGAKSIPVIYWNFVETEMTNNDGTKEVDVIPFLKYYNVFNMDQVEGIVVPEEVKDVVLENTTADKVIADYSKEHINITFEGLKAFYSPQSDYIKIPKRNTFPDDQNFYSTVFHEITHSTGHEDRLNRFKSKDEDMHFGSEPYSKEELVAEMGAVYLCSTLGIEGKTLQQSGAYIKSWLKALKDDKTLLVTAGTKAQKAVDFVLGNTKEDVNNNTEKKSNKVSKMQVSS